MTTIESHIIQPNKDGDFIFSLPRYKFNCSAIVIIIKQDYQEFPLYNLELVIGGNKYFQYDSTEIQLIARDTIFDIVASEGHWEIKVNLDKIFCNPGSAPIPNGLLHDCRRYSEIYFRLKCLDNIDKITIKTYDEKYDKLGLECSIRQLCVKYVVEEIDDHCTVNILWKHITIHKIIFCNINGSVWSVNPAKHGSYQFKISKHRIEYINEDRMFPIIYDKVSHVVVKYHIDIIIENGLCALYREPIIEIITE